MKALILSAGLGKRLRPLTWFTPKPMIRVCGRPIMEYAVDLLYGYGITEIVANIHYKPWQIVKYFGNRLIYSYEPELLGTAGTIKRLGDWLGDNFVVLNGDTISNVDLAQMIKIHFSFGVRATVFTKDTATHNGGAFVFNKSILNFIPSGTPFSIHEDLFLVDEVEKSKALFCGGASFYFDVANLKKLAKVRRYFKSILQPLVV